MNERFCYKGECEVHLYNEGGTEMENVKTERLIWMDWLRVIAIFFVFVVHSCEPFFFGGEGTLIRCQSDAVWIAVLNTLVRSCVPLFVVASSYLLFPVQTSTFTFFKRRASRLLIPFALWTLIYAFLNGSFVENLSTLWQNFNYSAGHLWFVYMIVGVYLLMPLLSPWAERVSQRELLFYISLCFVSALLPFLRCCLGEAAIVFGPGGLPNIAKYPLWGEASWNTYGTFYYLSGYMGYLLLGCYLRRFVKALSWTQTLKVALPCGALGFVMSAGGFLWSIHASAKTGFPVEGNIGLGATWEGFLLYDSIGVVLMTLAWLLCIRQIKSEGFVYQKLLLPCSRVSYGMYLGHMVLLVPLFGWIHPLMSAWIPTLWATPATIIATACATFVTSSLACLVLAKVPKVGKWIVG